MRRFDGGVISYRRRSLCLLHVYRLRFGDLTLPPLFVSKHLTSPCRMCRAPIAMMGSSVRG